MAAEEKREITIVDIRKVPAREPERWGKFDYLVTYQTDPLHTYILRIPEEDFSEEKLKEYIRKELEEVRKWVGKKLTI